MVEASTFSIEFIAMKVCIEHIVALQYILRMFGITLKCQVELPRMDQFTQFQRDLEKHILKTFDNPDDIVDLIKDLVDPAATMVRELPWESILMIEIDDLGLDPTSDNRIQEVRE